MAAISPRAPQVSRRGLVEAALGLLKLSRAPRFLGVKEARRVG